MSKLAKKQDMCSVCQAEPQDMLILSCRHNLCLDCATEVYNLNSKQDRIQCQICLSQTSLDQDTIICLRSLSAKNIKQATTAQDNYNLYAGQTRQNYPPIPKTQNSVYHNQQLPLIHQQISVQPPKCQKHNEPLTYYCLQCNFYKICSQCMLLENHRFHKVITLKKASVHIKQTIQKVGRQKLKLKNMLEKDRQSLLMRKQESQKQVEMNLLELKEVFDEIMKSIGQKYDQLRKKLQQEAGRKLQIMQGAINQIEQKINLIDQTVQFEDELIKSSFSNGNKQSGMFQMFEYYEGEMSQNRVDFQPSLPNFISEVVLQKIGNKQNVLNQIQTVLDQLIMEPIREHQESQQNINYISQIENENLYQINEVDGHKQKLNQYSMKKNRQQPLQQNYQIISQIHGRKPISQNINIIQLNSNNIKSSIKQRKQSTKNNNINIIQNSKKSKQSIDALKKKARQNIKDRQLSHSRKMQLSRSIENATDILNKIQQRTTRV